MLTLKKEHLQNLIELAEGLREGKGRTVDFKAFDTSKIDEYAQRAKEQWGSTREYAEFEERDRGRTPGERNEMIEQMMGLFVEFGLLKVGAPDSPEAQAQVKKLQDFISAHFYQCSDEVLAGLGQMYGAGGEFTENIDAAAGEGTARFAARAIEVYCMR